MKSGVGELIFDIPCAVIEKYNGEIITVTIEGLRFIRRPNE